MKKPWFVVLSAFRLCGLSCNNFENRQNFLPFPSVNHPIPLFKKKSHLTNVIKFQFSGTKTTIKIIFIESVNFNMVKMSCLP